MLGVILFGRGYKKRIAALEAKLSDKQTEPASDQPAEDSAAVYYLDAMGIVDMYIEVAISGMSDMARLSIRNEFPREFRTNPWRHAWRRQI